MTTILTQVELDGMTCSVEGCNHTAHDGLVFHSRCHTDQPTWSTYDAATGTLTIVCAVCEREIVTVGVAP